MTDEEARAILGEAIDLSRSNGTTAQVGVLCILAAELRLLREAVERKIEEAQGL